MYGGQLAHSLQEVTYFKHLNVCFPFQMKSTEPGRHSIQLQSTIFQADCRISTGNALSMTESYTSNSDTAELNWKAKNVGKNLQRIIATKVGILRIYTAESFKNLHY